LVYAYAQDFTVIGGSLGEMQAAKICKVMDMATKMGAPIIGINDSGGARIQEGVNALAGYGEIFYYNTLASGYIPQISIIAGNCAGGAVYSPGITDFIFVIDNISQMYVTGPKVIKSVTNEDITAEELGGANVHAQRSGVAHFYCKNEQTCYKKVRKLLDTIPQYYGEPKKDMPDFAVYETNAVFQYEMNNIIPAERNRAYNIKDVIKLLSDPNSFIEVMRDFAKNIVVGFAKIKGITVGYVANQPNYAAGALDCDASDKGARFIRYCDAYDIPIITLTDVPGFLPGSGQERKGIIRHGAKLLYAYSEATTTKLNVILRKAYGGAYIAMCSKHLRADFVYAWPNAEIAVMGAEGAVDILFAKEMKKLGADECARFRDEKIAEYNKDFMSARVASMQGYVDEVIKPEATRERLYADLLMLSGKKDIVSVEKKHGNIPL